MTTPQRSAGDATKLIGIAVGILCFFLAREGVGAAKKAYHRRTAPPVETATADALDSLNATSLLEAATRGMTNSQAESAGMALSARGVARLTPEMSLRRVQLLASIQQSTTVPICGQWWSGRMDLNVLRGIVTSLPRPQATEWAAMSASAMVAELRQAPRLSVGFDSAVVELFHGIASELSPPDRSRYLDVLADLNNQSDSAACWMGRLTNAHILSAPESQAKRRAQLLGILQSPAVR